VLMPKRLSGSELQICDRGGNRTSSAADGGKFEIRYIQACLSKLNFSFLVSVSVFYGL